MKKINYFVFLFSFLLLFSGAQAQMIINHGPNSWTLVLEGERVKVPAFGTYHLDYCVHSVEFYALEIVDNMIYTHGFCSLSADEYGYYSLQDLEPMPIFLINLRPKEILIEHHKTAFILHPGEQRELKDPYITYDSVIELKVSSLEEDVGILPLPSWHIVIFENGQGRVMLE